MGSRLLGRRWMAIRHRALDRDGWRCVQCGRPGALEVDHINGLDAGNGLDNLQSLCRRCHVAKTNRERGVIPLPEDWDRLVYGLTGT